MFVFDEILDVKELTEQDIYVLIASFAIVAVLAIGLFILKAIALCRMAKKRGYSNWWLGLIPYANFYLLGKLAGPVRIFRFDIKNVGLFLAISTFILDAIKVITLLASFSIFGAFKHVIYAIYQVSSLIELVYYFSYVSACFAIFGKYAPSRRLLFTVLSIIQPMLPILLIVIMNKKPYNNFDEYYKEQMAKRYGQTYNPYENPFSTKENPFNTSNNSNEQSNEIFEDPFDEFKGD